MSRGITCDFWGAVLGERGWWLSALSALSVLARAHVDKLGECPSLRPRPGGWHARMWIGYDDVDRLFTCG